MAGILNVWAEESGRRGVYLSLSVGITGSIMWCWRRTIHAFMLVCQNGGRITNCVSLWKYRRVQCLSSWEGSLLIIANSVHQLSGRTCLIWLAPSIAVLRWGRFQLLRLLQNDQAVQYLLVHNARPLVGACRGILFSLLQHVHYFVHGLKAGYQAVHYLSVVSRCKTKLKGRNLILPGFVGRTTFGRVELGSRRRWLFSMQLHSSLSNAAWLSFPVANGKGCGKYSAGSGTSCSGECPNHQTR